MVECSESPGLDPGQHSGNASETLLCPFSELFFLFDFGEKCYKLTA